MSEFLSAFSWINIRFLLMGLWVTIEVAVVSVILSFIIGSVLGVIRYEDSLSIKDCWFYY